MNNNIRKTINFCKANITFRMCYLQSIYIQQCEMMRQDRQTDNDRQYTMNNRQQDDNNIDFEQDTMNNEKQQIMRNNE